MNYNNLFFKSLITKSKLLLISYSQYLKSSILWVLHQVFFLLSFIIFLYCISYFGVLKFTHIQSNQNICYFLTKRYMGVILNIGTLLDHDVVIEEFAHLSVGVKVAGGQTIAAHSFLEVGTCILH